MLHTELHAAQILPKLPMQQKRLGRPALGSLFYIRPKLITGKVLFYIQTKFLQLNKKTFHVTSISLILRAFVRKWSTVSKMYFI
jgi:hypothetical protein